MGAICAAKGQYVGAKTHIEVSTYLKKKWQDEIPMSYLLCLSYQNLGSIHAELGDHAEASRYFEMAPEAGTIESSTLLMALTYHNYGLINLGLGNYEKARSLFEEAYQLPEAALGDSPDTAASLHLLACCHCKAGGALSLEAAR